MLRAEFFAKTVDGNMLLAKVNTDSRPPLARANGYITSPDASNYTIQADLKSIAVAQPTGRHGPRQLPLYPRYGRRRPIR